MTHILSSFREGRVCICTKENGVKTLQSQSTSNKQMSFVFTIEMMKIENTINIVSFLLKKQIDKHGRMRIVLFCFKNSGKLGGLVMLPDNQVL